MRDFPPAHTINDPHQDYLDPAYLSSSAYGFGYCHKLALDDPDLAVLNCNSVALCALGRPDLYLRKRQQKGETPPPPNIGFHLNKYD